MTHTATLTNPLDLPVEWRSGITPLHEVTNPDHAKALADAMERDGWNDPPIVADYELRSANQDKAYTGVHRLEAAGIAQDTCSPEVPCVYVEDLCEALGIDWDALMDGHGRDSYEAAIDLCAQLPADVREAYGFDVGGM